MINKFALAWLIITGTAYCDPYTDFLEKEIIYLDGIIEQYEVESGLDIQQLYYLIGMRDEAKICLEKYNCLKSEE